MNRLLHYTLTVIFAQLLFVGCADRDYSNYSRLERPEEAVYYHTPVGLCEDYPEETTTMDIIRGDMNLLKRSGIDLLRISFGWDAIEAEKDNYDWLFWDDYVKIAVDEYGITLIPYICYTPLWNSRGDTLMFWNDPPLNQGEFGQFMGDLVRRYKDKIKTWELWNEPDIKIYWDSGSAEEFSRFIKIGSKAVKDADPTARVVLGGLAHRPEFFRELFRDYGISDYVDIVNIHNYYETWHPRPVEMITDYIQEIAQIVEDYGSGQAIWMAEVGYSTFRQGTYVSEAYSAYYDYEHTADYQAVDLVKRLSLALSTEKLSAITWYEIKDLPQTEEVIGDNYNNRYLGVAYTDFTPKPAEHALRFFNTLFAEPVRSIDSQVVVAKNEDSDAVVRSFKAENGDAIVLAWLATNVPHKRPEKPEALRPDPRQEDILITVPGTFSDSVFQFDELGNEQTFKAVHSGENTVSLGPVPLNGGEVKIFKLVK